MTFNDRFAGRCTVDVAAGAGDFVIWRRVGLPAYQLAVVIDDARQGITAVVRGDDLIPSTGQQLLLARALELGPEPAYWHLPLVVGPDGKRLAKRHGDSRLARYRAQGVAGEQVVGLIAWSCGLTASRRAMSLDEFADALDLAMLAPTPYTFTAEDDQWLTDST